MTSPVARRTNTFFSRPDAITVCAPLREARLAASILVNIPPVPTLVPAPPAIRSNETSPAIACWINLAFLSWRGSAE